MKAPLWLIFGFLIVMSYASVSYRNLLLKESIQALQEDNLHGIGYLHGYNYCLWRCPDPMSANNAMHCMDECEENARCGGTPPIFGR